MSSDAYPQPELPARLLFPRNAAESREAAAYRDAYRRSRDDPLVDAIADRLDNLSAALRMLLVEIRGREL